MIELHFLWIDSANPFSSIDCWGCVCLVMLVLTLWEYYWKFIIRVSRFCLLIRTPCYGLLTSALLLNIFYMTNLSKTYTNNRCEGSERGNVRHSVSNFYVPLVFNYYYSCLLLPQWLIWWWKSILYASFFQQFYRRDQIYFIFRILMNLLLLRWSSGRRDWFITWD